MDEIDLLLLKKLFIGEQVDDNDQVNCTSIISRSCKRKQCGKFLILYFIFLNIQQPKNIQQNYLMCIFDIQISNVKIFQIYENCEKLLSLPLLNVNKLFKIFNITPNK